MLVCIGECMVEVAPNGMSAHSLGFAGDTFNVAQSARLLLGAAPTVRYVTAIGTDWISDAMLASFLDAGIDTRFVRRDPERTVGLYAIRVVAGERFFAYWRSASAATRLGDDPEFLRQSITDAAIVFLSGITVAILPPQARTTLWQALQRQRARGTVIAFDPNYRARLWKDASEARHEITRFLAASDIALPTFSDEAELFGDTDPRETLVRIWQYGVPEIVVKNGPEAAWCLSGMQPVSIPAQPVAQVVDTTGAGDAFNGAYLSSRLRRIDVKDAVSAAHHVAACSVSIHGALLNLGDLVDHSIHGA